MESGNEISRIGFFYPDDVTVRHYTEAIKRNPKDPRKLSWVLCKAGAISIRFKDAERLAECKTRLSKTLSKILYRKGIELFKEKKYHDAVRHYPEATKRNPKDLRARPFLIILCASVLHIRQPSCLLHKTCKFFQGRHIRNKRDVKMAIKTILDVDLIEVKGDRGKSMYFNAGYVAKGLRHPDEKYDKEKWEILSSVVSLLSAFIVIVHERIATQ
ncbi:hypothetical protein Bca101_083743 [Brassica carinata]